MIDASLVTERFLLLASMEQADETVETLCSSGADRVEHILKEDADRSDDRVISAAASYAFYQWVLINKTAATDDFKSFRAGDITVQNDVSVSIKAAKTVCDEAFEALAGLVDDRDFYFGEVLINDIEPSF